MTTLRRGVCTFLLALGVALVAPLSAQQEWAATLDRFSERIAADVATDDVGGIVIGVAVDGDVIWADASGWADRERRRSEPR